MHIYGKYGYANKMEFNVRAHSKVFCHGKDT